MSFIHMRTIIKLSQMYLFPAVCLFSASWDDCFSHATDISPHFRTVEGFSHLICFCSLCNKPHISTKVMVWHHVNNVMCTCFPYGIDFPILITKCHPPHKRLGSDSETRVDYFCNLISL